MNKLLDHYKLISRCAVDHLEVITWLNFGHDLDSRGAITNNGHPFVLILEVLWPICRVYHWSLETVKTFNVGELPLTTPVSL